MIRFLPPTDVSFVPSTLAPLPVSFPCAVFFPFSPLTGPMEGGEDEGGSGRRWVSRRQELEAKREREGSPLLRIRLGRRLHCLSASATLICSSMLWWLLSAPSGFFADGEGRRVRGGGGEGEGAPGLQTIADLRSLTAPSFPVVSV